MQAITATLQCSNPNCQQPNPETHIYCYKCSNPLVKRYLWVDKCGISNYRSGELLHERFLIKSAKILLDTQPNCPIQIQTQDSNLAQSYLKLFSYRPHIPLPYSVLNLDNEPQEILLLADAPISSYDLSKSGITEIGLGAAVPFEMAWSLASALRQLNWLWQIAQLWEPLAKRGVASTLLQPSLLRVEGSLVRLLELRPDPMFRLNLADLGRVWQSWLPGAHAEIIPFLSALCDQLIHQEIQATDQLVERMDQALMSVGRSQSIQFTVAAQTDQGLSRSRNEDACYCSDRRTFVDLPLMIVCDGMGGHAGGDVASTLAVRTITQHIQSAKSSLSSSNELVTTLENSIYEANDLINQLNERHQNQSYERMGTTVVAAFVYPPKMYIASVGDSPAYLITRHGCHQITTDDNAASRWIESGISFYHDTLYNREGAKLFQALGVQESKFLRPRMRQFVVDEDCIFLLCSDGLSDYQRVEECWKTELLPVLEGQVKLAVASSRLIDLANRKNGHDNVTVSLVHCRVL